MTTFVQEARVVSRFKFVPRCAAMALSLPLVLPGCSSERTSPRTAMSQSHAIDSPVREDNLPTTHSPARHSEEPAESASNHQLPEVDQPRRIVILPDSFADPAIDLGAPGEIEAEAVITSPMGASQALPDATATSNPWLPRDDGDFSTNFQAPPAPPLDLAGAIDLIRGQLSRQAAAADRPTREHLMLAALSIIDPDPVLEAPALGRLSDEHRALLAAYAEFSRRLGEETAASGEEAALLRLLDNLRLAIAPPAPPPPLTIPIALFCTRVDGFGKYETFDRNAFLAGRAQQVVIYSEVAGFLSALDANRRLWETRLSQALTIENAAGTVVWQQDWQPAPDLAARKRMDFFISHIITLPDTLGPGEYTLTVRVKDDAAAGEAVAAAAATIPFAIVDDAKLAATVPE